MQFERPNRLSAIELKSSRGKFSSIAIELKIDGQRALRLQVESMQILYVLKPTCFETSNSNLFADFIGRFR